MKIACKVAQISFSTGWVAGFVGFLDQCSGSEVRWHNFPAPVVCLTTIVGIFNRSSSDQACISGAVRSKQFLFTSPDRKLCLRATRVTRNYCTRMQCISQVHLKRPVPKRERDHSSAQISSCLPRLSHPRIWL